MPNQMDATWGAHRGSLVALDARDLHKLWSDDCIFYFAKYNPPIVANGGCIWRLLPIRTRPRNQAM